MKIEYIIIKPEDDFCNSIESINNLLRSNSMSLRGLVSILDLTDPAALRSPLQGGISNLSAL